VVRRTESLIRFQKAEYFIDTQSCLCVQWWPLVVANVWAMFSVPPAGMLITTVLLVNLGGVYNCIAYTVIRRRLQQQKATRGPQVVLSNGSRPTAAANAESHSDQSITAVSAAGPSMQHD
jgi:hypothetical protein